MPVEAPGRWGCDEGSGVSDLAVPFSDSILGPRL